MKPFIYKKFTLKELSGLYGKQPRSFQTWIKDFNNEIGVKRGWDYTPGQVRIIVSHLGLPEGYVDP